MSHDKAHLGQVSKDVLFAIVARKRLTSAGGEYMLNDTERQERQPEAIQRELLEINRRLEEYRADLQGLHKAWQNAKIAEARVKSDTIRCKALYDTAKNEIDLLLEQRSSLQSVLKSLV